LPRAHYVCQRTYYDVEPCLNEFCALTSESAAQLEGVKMYIGGGALILIIILAVLFLR